MKLSTMKLVVDTLDNQGKSALAEHILERWKNDIDSVRYVRSSANFVFAFRRDGCVHYLRFNHACERDLRTLEAEIKILNHLKLKSLCSVKPVKSLSSRYIETVHTDSGTFFAVVFEKIEGCQYDFNELGPDHFFRWGKTLGELHSAFKESPAEYCQHRAGWKDHLSFIEERLPEHEQAARMEWSQVSRWAKGLKLTDRHFGLVHYDFELDNLVWSDNQIGILDFDDAACYPYVADIAYALQDLFQDGVHFDHPLFQKFIEGYRTKTEFDPALLEDISWFMRMHDLVSFAKLLRSVDLTQTESGPLLNLRNKLVEIMHHHRLSFQKHNNTK